MTDTINIVELPVGAGKTFHMLNQIQKMDGDVIFAAPTIMLCEEVHKELSKIGDHNVSNILATSNETGAGQRVSDYIFDSIRSCDGQVNVICTHAGLSCADADMFKHIKDKKGTKLNVIIDELPGLFQCYSRRFSAELKAQLETVISVSEGAIKVIDEGLYQQVIEQEFYHPDCVKLLKLRNNVRMIHDPATDEWLFFGYELNENLSDIFKIADKVYFMASTITGTLDEIILKDICGFKLEKAEDIYDCIDVNELIDRAKRAHIIPLLDSPYSRGKAFDNDYKAKSGKCLSEMISKAKDLIQDNEAIIIPNTWAMDVIRSELMGVSNIQVLSPNVKGINSHQDKHWCCALYTSKPTPAILKSLKLLAEIHQLDKTILIDSYVLQYDLDMITQMCGRISIRDRNAEENCTFIVPDQISAKHFVKVLTGNLDLYEQLVDESEMICWDDMVESNTQIGRPLSDQKKQRLELLEIEVTLAEDEGRKVIKNKILATMYGVKPGQISKDLKSIREKCLH